MVACSDDDNNDKSPIKGLEIPQSTTPVKPGASVTIKGEGFTQASEVWFRAIATRAENREDVKATVTEVNANGITFIAPEVYGNQSILLKENGKEFELGKMTFEEEPEEVEDVKILPKKIKEIKVYEELDYYTIYRYDYNGNGTIKEITKIDMNGAEGDRQTFTYTTNKITSIENDDQEDISTYNLENGRLKSYTWSATYNGETGKETEGETYEVDYNGDYLSTVKITDLYESQYNSNENISFIGGKLMSYDYKYPNDPVNNGYTKFEYGTQLNNLNIDLFGIIGECFFDSALEELYLLNVCGKRSNYVPQKMEYHEEGDDDGDGEPYNDTEFCTFDYQMDGEYISTITVLNEDKEMDWKFEITYEQ